MADQKYLEGVNATSINSTPQTENLQLEPEHRRRALRYMKRLNGRHMSTWPKAKSFPRYKV